MAYQFHSELSPENIRERVARLPQFPAYVEPMDNMICGVPTRHGARIWYLGPRRYYRGWAEPETCVLRIREEETGSRVNCRFTNRENWKGSAFIAVWVFLLLSWELLQGKAQPWWALPLSVVEAGAITWGVQWAFGKLCGVFRVREYRMPLLAWVERSLLHENGVLVEEPMEREIQRVKRTFAFDWKKECVFYSTLSAAQFPAALQLWIEAERQSGLRLKASWKDARLSLRGDISNGSWCWHISPFRGTVSADGRSGCLLRGRFTGIPIKYPQGQQAVMEFLEKHCQDMRGE